MNKLYYFILFCFAALCFTACSDDDLEFSGIEGKDHYISDFALNVGGITYQATIAGDKITVEIPYNTDLKGATAAYTLSEGATINPNPSTIQDWENEWKFVVTSKMQESKVFSYTYRYADIEQSGSVFPEFLPPMTIMSSTCEAIWARSEEHTSELQSPS